MTTISEDLTFNEIFSSSYEGRYFDFTAQQWQSVGKLERIVRAIFGALCIIDNLETSILRRTFRAIQAMDTVPIGIEKDIKLIDLSLHIEGPLYYLAYEVSELYARVMQKGSFDIQQDAKRERSFGIFEDKQLTDRVLNTEWGRLKFYTLSDNTFIFSYDNSYDRLQKVDPEEVVATSYCSLYRQMRLYSPCGELLYVVENDRTGSALLIRDAKTFEKVALAHMYGSYDSIKWRVSYLQDESEGEKYRFAFMALKYSQMYHFQEPRHCKDVPTMQDYQN